MCSMDVSSILMNLPKLSARSRRQGKRIKKFLKSQGKNYFSITSPLQKNICENVLTTAEEEKAIEAYLKMCNDFVVAHIFFKRNSVYPIQSQDEAKKNVYDNPEVMSYYSGLMISYFFWEDHFKILNFSMTTYRVVSEITLRLNWVMASFRLNF